LDVGVKNLGGGTKSM